MSKRPSFQFYPSDWLRDTSLRACSEGARGLWMDMLCYMHEGSPYGYLKVNDMVILPEILSRMTGISLDILQGYLSELSCAGVYSMDGNCIYSRRMIRDEQIRENRGSGGKKGGNPALMKDKVNLKDNLTIKTKDNHDITPSSSSSSSINISSINIEERENENLESQLNHNSQIIEKEKKCSGEKKKEPDLVFPWDSPAFYKYWDIWVLYKKKRKLQFIYESQQAALKKLGKEYTTMHEAIEAIEYSIAQGYTGIFRDNSIKQNQNNNQSRNQKLNDAANAIYSKKD